MQLIVFFEGSHDTSYLVIVPTDDLESEQLFNVFAVFHQVVFLVGLKLFLQPFQLGLDAFKIAFFFGHVLEVGQGLLAFGSIGEVLLFHKVHEVLIGGVVDFEVFGRGDAWVFVDELGGIVEDVVFGIEVCGHRRIFRGFDLYIGHDAMAFVNGASRYGFEGFAERVLGGGG